jgi:hypothetical protein
VRVKRDKKSFRFSLLWTYTLGRMQICPINREWIHNHLLEPYLQGCALITIAWNGFDRSLAPTPLSLSDRVVCWLQGVALMIPFVNTIIWLAWQAFGTPEKLFDPYCPEAEPPPPPPPPVIIHGPVQPAPIQPPQNAGELVRPTELFGILEKTDTSQIQMGWRIEHYADMIVAQQNCELFSSTSIYRPNYSLREYHYQMGTKRTALSQTGGERSPVHLTITDTGVATIERDIPLIDNLPLIQQRAVGLRPFVQSNERVLRFCAIIPEIPAILNHVPFLAHAPFIMPVVATKMGEEEVPGMGRLLKIEVVSEWRWPYNSAKTEMWYDVATGQLRKFIDTGTFISTKTGEFVRSNP